MCGFAGFTGAPNGELLEKMDRAIERRGPDQFGKIETPALSLAHRRLAIIDVSTEGKQPMETRDGRFVVAYNGEIYNYLSLRQRYEREGWIFHTKTDTECLLASAALHGLTDLGEIRGIFSFILWDRQENVVWFARDRHGVKPLYTVMVDGRFAFSSEIPGLLPLKRQWQLNEAAKAAYFTLGFVPGPQTLFTGIESVEAGHLFRLNISELQIKPILSFKQVKNERGLYQGTRSDAIKELRSLLPQAVADQMISDRPVGFFLSGGLDSSLLLTQARKLHPDAALKSFTTRFQSVENDPKFNVDARLAKETAAFFKTNHTEVEITPTQVIDRAQHMARIVAQPSANSTMIALEVIAERAAQDVAVVLAGDGGDEVFAGYERHRRVWLSEPWLEQGLVRWTGKYLAKSVTRANGWLDLFSGESFIERYRTYFSLPRSIRASLFGQMGIADEIIQNEWQKIVDEAGTKSSLQKALLLDRQTWLREDAFVRADRLSMFHGLELRVPLLDDRLVAFAERLPDDFLLSRTTTKTLLRDAFAEDLPAQILREPKRGWIAPAAKWLRYELHDWAYQILQEACHDHAWLNHDLIDSFWKEHQEKKHYRLLELWSVIGYQLWWREYKHVFSS